jgi:hypothetical protein
VIEKLPAGRGQGHAASDAIEEPESEFLLQGLDRMAYRRLGEMQLPGGHGEAADASEGREGEEFSTIQNRRHGVGAGVARPDDCGEQEPSQTPVPLREIASS